MKGERINFVVLILALAAAAVCGVGWSARTQDFFRGYLPAFLFWLGVAIGPMAFLLIHQLTGGDWGVAIRRPASACVLTLPLMAVLFVPVMLGVGRIYPWAGGAAVRETLHLGNKAAYLTPTFFVIRAVIYFVIWIGTGFVLLSLLGVRQEQEPDVARAGRLRAVGAAGLILYVLTTTLAAVDWMMSLDPGWFSSIYGFYVIAGQGLSGMAAMVVAVVGRGVPGVPGVRNRKRGGGGTGGFRGAGAGTARLSLYTRGRGGRRAVLHDLGNLLFMTVFFYAYIAFSQWMIIWSGDKAEEVTWYTSRRAGAWRFVPAAVLAVIHFGLPFAALAAVTEKQAAGAGDAGDRPARARGPGARHCLDGAPLVPRIDGLVGAAGGGGVRGCRGAVVDDVCAHGQDGLARGFGGGGRFGEGVT